MEALSVVGGRKFGRELELGGGGEMKGDIKVTVCLYFC